MRIPRGLSKEEKAIWKDAVSEHSHLVSADTSLLIQYCQLRAQLDSAIQTAKQTGPLATSEKGSKYMSPILQVVAMLQPKVVRLARELGIIYSTRPAAKVVATRADKKGKPDIRPFKRA